MSNSDFSPLLSVIISAITGIIAGAIASLIAPWVHWRIEKDREKLKARRETLQKCRLILLDSNLDWLNIPRTTEYLIIRAYLTDDERNVFEADPAIPIIDVINPYKNILLKAIERLEKHWDLN